jgi:glucose 1-dehydrogenase
MKVAIVTGSSQGIGQAIAARLAQDGINIAIDYRTHAEGAAETLRQVEAAGAKGVIVKADLSLVTEINHLVEQTVATFGRIDILVNNAGIEKRNDYWQVSESEYDAVMDVNLKGVFFATQQVVRHLQAEKRPGKIINISSVHEELPFPHFTSYCMSKGGLKMMTRNLAIELAPFEITVNSVAPGAIQTAINKTLLNNPAELNSLLANIPLKRLGQPRDVAEVVAFLASDKSDYITGTTIFVDGGLLWNYQEQ